MPGPLPREAAGLSLGCGLDTGAFKFCPGDSDVQPMVRTPHPAGLPSAGHMSITWGARQASRLGPYSRGSDSGVGCGPAPAFLTSTQVILKSTQVQSCV